MSVKKVCFASFLLQCSTINFVLERKWELAAEVDADTEAQVEEDPGPCTTKLFFWNLRVKLHIHNKQAILKKYTGGCFKF